MLYFHRTDISEETAVKKKQGHQKSVIFVTIGIF